MDIIFEDDNYIILNKPAGMLVHPDGRADEGTKEKKGKKASFSSVTEWLSKKYPALENVGGELEVQHGDPVKRWGIAHRIDRETSGILVVAKNQEAFDHIQKHFQDRYVEKTYHAFVYGRVTIDAQTINLPIGRSKLDFRRWSAEKDARGTMREAVTLYRVIHRTNEATFVEVMPKTGRTHQIRVHFKAIGNPIVADSFYAPLRKPILGFERLALHARSIVFNGLAGELISVTAPYPPDFENAIKLLGVGQK